MKRPSRLDDKRLEAIATDLRAGRPVRRAMPGWGRLHIDRPLPFLVVYRRPSARPDAGTERLAVGVASYLLADGDPSRRAEVSMLVDRIAREMSEIFGAFLIIELWADEDISADEPITPCAGYRLISRKLDSHLRTTIAEIGSALGESRILRQPPGIGIEQVAHISPPGMRVLLDSRRLDAAGADIIGIGVRPVFRSIEGEPYPALVRQFSRRLATAFDRGAYRFTHARTTARPVHYHALGRRAFVKAVFDVDAALAEVGEAFDPLLLVTPINIEQAWTAFKRSRFAAAPGFVYRPVPFDIGRMKHRLWSIRPERVEDPTLLHLFRDTQRSLDRQISLVGEVERNEFVHTSRQLYGSVSPGLLALAEQLLDTVRPHSRSGPYLSAHEFADLAAEELQAYRVDHPYFGIAPQVRDDIYSGLLVSRGRMFIGSAARIPVRRADALLQHEVGTHVVTHHNGRAQPLRLLALGLPGYDELQEGLAVLGEYLAGGLTPERLRLLGGRVVAVHAMLDGAEFPECWSLLVQRGFTQRAAFTIAARVYRGGGLTKDAMYLRGLVGILEYMGEGCDFGRLFLGKYAIRHVPVMDELLLRKVLSPPLVLPRYLQREDSLERLARLARGVTVPQLMKG